METLTQEKLEQIIDQSAESDRSTTISNKRIHNLTITGRIINHIVFVNCELINNRFVSCKFIGGQFFKCDHEDNVMEASEFYGFKWPDNFHSNNKFVNHCLYSPSISDNDPVGLGT